MTTLNLLNQLRNFNLLPFGNSGSSDESIDDPISEYDFATKGYVDTEISGKGSPAPTGAMVMFASSTPPSGWFLCDGSAVSRTENSSLFALLGTQFGIGDGANTFNLPDLRGRFPLGMDDPGAGTAGAANVVANAAADTMGGTSGSEKVTLTSAEMPSHSHSGSAGSSSHSHSASSGSGGSHSHSYTNSNVNGTVQSGSNATVKAGNFAGTTTANGAHSHSVSVGSDSHSHSVSVGSAGSGDAHDNMPPFMAVNYIIKA